MQMTCSTFLRKEIHGRLFQQIDVSFSCFCPFIDHAFRHNIVEVAVDPRSHSQLDLQTSLTML